LLNVNSHLAARRAKRLTIGLKAPIFSARESWIVAHFGPLWTVYRLHSGC
jgi:hypothetical protein